MGAAMSGKACKCGWRFMDAEDYRDHLPCPGSLAEQAAVKATRDAVEHVRQWANATEQVHTVGEAADQIIRRILGQPPREWPPKKAHREEGGK
jgi:hypothetical protein